MDGYAKWARSLTFTVRRKGKPITAGSRYNTHISDNDLHGPAQHPFVLQRAGGGRRVMKTVRQGLNKRGVAKVRVRARGAGGVDSHLYEIVLAECAQDPPFYPLSCEIKS